LKKLTSADVFYEQKGIALARLIAGSCDAIGEEGKLCARAAWKLHLVYLRGIAKSSFDQHLALGRMPAGKARCAKFAVASDRFRQRRGNLGNTLSDKIFIRTYLVALRKCDHRQK
jgi:hypothetical protein